MYMQDRPLFFSVLAWLGTANLVQSTDQHAFMPQVRCSYKQYVSLGDSYSAGIQANPNLELPICNGNNGGNTGPYCTTSTCAKNQAAYPWLFDQTYRQDNFAFIACSGADTDDCSKIQVPSMPGKPDLISITIGGNNNDAFSRVVTRCVYVPLKPGCTAALQNGNATVQGIAAALDALFNQIKSTAPSAKVVVLGYVMFWPRIDIPANCQSASLQRPTADQKTFMNMLVQGMNIQLKTAADAHNFQFVDPNALFEGHRLCEKDPYLQWDLMDLPGFDDGDNDGVDDRTWTYLIMVSSTLLQWASKCTSTHSKQRLDVLPKNGKRSQMYSIWSEKEDEEKLT